MKIAEKMKIASAAAKELQKLAPIPVVMLTVKEQQDFAFAMGVADYLRKPVSAAEVTYGVKRTLLRRITFDLTGLPPTPVPSPTPTA